MKQENNIKSVFRPVVTILLFELMLFSFSLSSEKPTNSKPLKSLPVTLADTQWRLLEFQSMDDAVGVKRTDDPSKYTMQLHKDGTVTMKLNCNVAKGTWIAEAGQDPSSGRLNFGPLATTKAFCPPPSMDQHVSMQIPYIRSYLLKDERLYLSLMADGGIYVWEPHKEMTSHMEADHNLEMAILSASPDYTQTIVDIQGSAGKARYVYDRVDLNDDGLDEVFVYLMGSFFCGTGGCDLLLFTDTKNGYSLINEFSTVRIPVIVSNEKTNGWKNITWLKSGGGVKSSYLQHTFNGKHYVESKSLPGDTAPVGQNYLSGNITFDKGIPLDPKN